MNLLMLQHGKQTCSVSTKEFAYVISVLHGLMDVASFPGFPPFLPRESSPVAVGYVSARFLEISEKWSKGRAGKLKFVSTELTYWTQ